VGGGLSCSILICLYFGARGCCGAVGTSVDHATANIIYVSETHVMTGEEASEKEIFSVAQNKPKK